MYNQRINFREEEMQDIVAHGGLGLIRWKRFFESRLNSNINFIDRAILPPNSSIGHHLHRDSEEIYFILSGHGEMSLGNSNFTVHPYDIIINPGTFHGLTNNSDSDIEIFVVEIKLPLEEHATRLRRSHAE